MIGTPPSIGNASAASCLPRIEPEPEEARVTEHDKERIPLAPRQPELGELHLRLVARRSLEAHDRLGRRARADAGDVVADRGDAARIAGGPDFLEQPHGGQLAIGREPRR